MRVILIGLPHLCEWKVGYPRLLICGGGSLREVGLARTRLKDFQEALWTLDSFVVSLIAGSRTLFCLMVAIFRQENTRTSIRCFLLPLLDFYQAVEFPSDPPSLFLN